MLSSKDSFLQRKSRNNEEIDAFLDMPLLWPKMEQNRGKWGKSTKDNEGVGFHQSKHDLGEQMHHKTAATSRL